ncbi:MAG: hypothetical protein CMJ64_22275 [Planctomycetaceae bacterium]|nr:hypothetical protein [Planctomycetaceae bacterium]
MAFVNLSLLFGGLLTAIPVVLHLVMRQQPKRMVFPALQFLRQRRETNRRTLQLRHWLLLALRCTAIVLLALTFARPSVLSAAAGKWAMIALAASVFTLVAALETIAVVQRRGKVLIGVLAGIACVLLIAFITMIVGALSNHAGALLGDEEAPVAAVLVFDTSPRMEYRYQNKTRLEAAQEIGDWLLRQFPTDSEVAVLDTRAAPAAFAVDMSAAEKAIDRLRMIEVSESLPSVAHRALDLLAADDKSRKEVYLLTDLSAASWQPESTELAAALERHPDVLVYVIDVGAAQLRNRSLGALDLSAETLAKSNELVVSTEVRSTGTQDTLVVQLFVEEPDPTLPIIVDGTTRVPLARRRGQEELTIAADESKHVEFRLSVLETGVHHGFVQLSGTDGLSLDDVRHFTVEVTPAWPVLVVAPGNVATSLFSEAIAPFEFRQTGQARFDCTTTSQAGFANRELDKYAAVCLLDPQPTPSVVWQKLAKYVRGGGGLVVFLGHNAQATTSFNDDAAQALLGGRLARVWRAPDRSLHLAPDQFSHPILAAFRDRPTSVPWNTSPIFKHWVLDPVAADSVTVIPFGNGKPALVDRQVGRGRVITLATPVSDSLRPSGRSAWNELPTSEQAWPYVVLVNKLMLYVTNSTSTRLNYAAGETAALTNDASAYPERYQLFTPLEEPQEIRAHEGELVVRFTEHAGAYRLKGVRDRPFVRGFSVNLPPQATELTRLSTDRLDTLLGKGRYQVAKNKDEIQLEVGEARVGREFYSHLLVLLVVVLSVEQLMANRFYKKAT